MTNMDAALKDDYGPGLRNAINNSNVVYTEVAMNDTDIVGRRAVWSDHTGRSTSTAARGELGTLPTADRQRYTQLSEDLVSLYHTIQVSGQSLHLTKNDTGSFVRALESEIKGAERDVPNDLERQVMNDFVTINSIARTGTIGGAITGVAALVITLGNATLPEMRTFFVNERVDVINGTTGAVRGVGTITAVNKTSKTITLDAMPGSSAAGDFVVREGNLNLEINGLRGLVSATKPFAGIDPATVPEWASPAVGSSTTTISETFLDELSESVETDGDGGTPNLYITDHLQRRKLSSMLQAQKRYDGREMTLKAGWKGLQIAQGTLVVGRYCPTTSVFALQPKEITRFVGLDWTWDEDDGRILHRETSDSVGARYKSYCQLVATNRNSHAVGTLAVPSF